MLIMSNRYHYRMMAENRQLDRIPEEVRKKISEELQIFEEEYQTDKYPFSQGGYVVVLEESEEQRYSKLCAHYGIGEELKEFTEEIMRRGEYQWLYQLVLRGAEEAIVIFFAKKIYEPHNTEEHRKEEVMGE